MRKKLFAILMSAMMMVSFMPSMALTAFAGDTVNTQEEFNNAVEKASSGDTISVGAGTFNLQQISVKDGKSLTFVGAGYDSTILQYGQNTAGEGGGCYSFDGAGNITFKNVCFEDLYPSYKYDFSHGFVRANGMVFENCKFTDTIGSWGCGSVTVKNCIFDPDASAEYCLKTYAGTSFNFEGCTFNGNNKGFFNIYRQWTPGTPVTVVVKDCTFNRVGNTSKTPIYFYDVIDNGGTWNISLEGTMTNVDNKIPVNEVSGSWLWGDMKTGANLTTVTLNGTKVWENGAKVEAPTYEAQVILADGTTKENFDTFAKAIDAVDQGGKYEDCTVMLLKDLDVVVTSGESNKAAYCIDGGSFTIDGDNHSITASVNNSSSKGGYVFNVRGNVIAKNIRIRRGTCNVPKNPGMHMKGGFNVASNVSLVLKNCDVDVTNPLTDNDTWGCAAIVAGANSKITVESGTYKGGSANDVYAIDIGANTEFAFIEGTTNGIKMTNDAAKYSVKDGTHTAIYAESGITVTCKGVTGGSFSADPSAYVFDGYEAIAQGTTPEIWTVQKKKPVVIIDNEETSKQVVIKQDTVIDEGTATEFYGENAEAAKQATKVEGVELTTEGENSGVQAIVNKALENTENAEAIKTADELEVKVDVVVTPKAYTEASTLKFDLTPVATLVAKDENGQETAKVEGIEVTNEMINQTQNITVNVFSDFEPKTVLHVADNGETTSYTKGQTPSGSTFTYDATAKKVTLIVHHFSDVLLFNEECVAMIGDTGYATLAEAIEAAKKADTTEGKTIKIVGTVDEAYSFAGDCSGITFLGSESGKATKGWTVQGAETNMSNITIDGVKFCEGGNIVFSTAAADYSNLTIENCTFTGTGAASTHGIQVAVGDAPYAGITIKNNKISDFSGDGSTAILMNIPKENTNSGTVTIEGNKITNFGHNGVQFIIDTADLVIKDNEFTRSNNKTILNLAAAKSVSVTGNTFNVPDNYTSFFVGNDTNQKVVDITDNTFKKETGSFEAIDIAGRTYGEAECQTFVGYNLLKNEAGKYISGYLTSYDEATVFPTNLIADGYEAAFVKTYREEDVYVYQIQKKQWEVIADQKLVNIYTADGLFAFADSCKTEQAKAYSGYEIHIKDDMDITGKSWTTIDAWETWDGLTIDGENHTITGLGVPAALTDRNNPHNYGGAFITNVHGSTVVKNITFDRATVTAQNGSQVAVIIGMSYGDVTFENVTVSNSKIDTTTKAGAFLGQNDEGLVALNDCTLVNTTVKAEYSFALMVGLLNTNSNGVAFDNCSADEDSKIILATPEAGTEFAKLDEFAFEIDGNKFWIHDPNGAWAEQRVTDQKCKYYGTEYTVNGGKFYYADKVVTLPEVYPAVAQIGDKQYGTLEDAIAAVPDNGTIEMIADVDNAAGISVDTKKTFTIDFKGHIYTVNKPGAGSTGTQTQAFQLIKDQTITFKNGTINAAEDNLTEAVSPAKNIKRFFQNYANLTLENMTIDGTNIYGENSVIEFANGTVNITGNTSITAKAGVKAINVDTWKGSYPEGAHITINTTGTIGDIYLYAEETGTFTKSSLTINNGKFASVTGDVSGDYTVELKGGQYSSQPNSDYVAEGYSVYKMADPVVYVVSNADPTHSAGMNTWTLNSETGLYEESYVAPPTPVTPADDTIIPEKIEEATSIDVSKDVEVKKDESGVVAAKTELSEKLAEELVKTATENKSAEVVIAATATTTETVDKAEVALPVKAIEELAKVDTVQTIVIQTNVAEVALDKEAAVAIAEQSPEGATIIVEAVREDEKSKEVAQDVYELKIIAVHAGSKTEIGDFKGGKVTVKVDIPEGLTGKKVACLYRDNNGKYTRRAVTKQDDVNGFFSFTTNHFSDYIVTEESTAQKMLVNQTDVAQKKLKTYASGKIKVSFAKVTYDTELGKKVQTYQIYRSTKKNSGFKKVGTVTNKKKSTKTITFTNSKKLKKGKKYYYKVRGRVQLANGKYAYTKWSNVRYAKCKKSR